MSIRILKRLYHLICVCSMGIALNWIVLWFVVFLVLCLKKRKKKGRKENIHPSLSEPTKPTFLILPVHHLHFRIRNSFTPPRFLVESDSLFRLTEEIEVMSFASVYMGLFGPRRKAERKAGKYNSCQQQFFSVRNENPT